MIDSSLSQKIKFLSFFASICVLFIHGTFVDAGRNLIVLQEFIRPFLNLFFFYFFGLSGYLFAVSKRSMKDRVLSRIRNLLVPYVIGNLFFLLLFVILNRTPGLSQMVNTDVSDVITGPIGRVMWKIFMEPVAFHLWFVRDLLLITLLAPLFLWVKEEFRLFVLFAALLVDLLTSLEITALVAFLVGMWYIAGRTFAYFDLNLGGLKLVMLLAIYLFFVYFLNPERNIFYYGLIPLWFVWIFCEKLLFSERILNREIFNKSFFIYLYHIPLINVWKKLAKRFFYNDEIAMVLAYITIPFITVGVLWILSVVLSTYMPRLYKIITGNRG